MEESEKQLFKEIIQDAEELLADDARFKRGFRFWNAIWLVIAVVSVVTSAIDNLAPYRHDWRFVAIIVLSFLMIAIYALSIYLSTIRQVPKGCRAWPPPLWFSVSLWGSSYIVCLLLILINPNLSWNIFVTFGMSFMFFTGTQLFLFVTILFVTLCISAGIFIPPISWGGVFGIFLAFYGTATGAAFMQRLISERYVRNRLLLQLSTTNSELEQAHRQLAASAVQEQELAVLRERTRLAREMHDTLGHALVLVSVKLEAIQRLRDRDPERFERELRETKEVVRNSMNELRASIANLRSPALEREPACRALSRYAREMAVRTGWRVTYDLGPDIEGLPEYIEETLWKVGQEALTNIEKHAQAQNVVLSMHHQDGRIFLSVQDDGIGMPIEQYERIVSPANHYGLSGMVERVEEVGGEIKLSPAPEHGTVVMVDLPLVEQPGIAPVADHVS